MSDPLFQLWKSPKVKSTYFHKMSCTYIWHSFVNVQYYCELRVDRSVICGPLVWQIYRALSWCLHNILNDDNCDKNSLAGNNSFLVVIVLCGLHSFNMSTTPYLNNILLLGKYARSDVMKAEDKKHCFKIEGSGDVETHL